MSFHEYVTFRKSQFPARGDPGYETALSAEGFVSGVHFAGFLSKYTSQSLPTMRIRVKFSSTANRKFRKEFHKEMTENYSAEYVGYNRSNDMEFS